MECAEWGRWVPVLENMLANLKALHTYLRGDMSYEDYCKQVGVLSDGLPSANLPNVQANDGIWFWDEASTFQP